MPIETGVAVLVGSNLLLAMLTVALLIFFYRSGSQVEDRLKQFQTSTHEKLAEMMALLGNSAPGEAVSPNDLDLLANILNGLNVSELDSLENSAGDMGDLVSQLSTLAPGDYERWKSEQQTQIDHVISNRNRYRQEAALLREKLEHASAMILTLQSKAKRLGNAQAQVVSLNAARESLQRELDNDRNRRTQTATELASLRSNESTLLDKLEALSSSYNKLDERTQEQLQDLATQLAVARGQHMEVQRILDRTLVEKHFIEEVFLETENAAGSMQAGAGRNEEGEFVTQQKEAPQFPV